MQTTRDINIRACTSLVSPHELMAEFPISEAAARTVITGREDVKRILSGEDERLIVVVGPCSIHDPKAGLEYAQKLARLAQQVRDKLLVIMRIYFEKPRTIVGWKGLINDPHLDDSFDIATGLKLARQVLLQAAEMGLPAATELLEPITPQYIADLITLASIGARTTESPTHRQMASGLSMPVGFKNGTEGNLDVAINAMQAAQNPHSFLGIDHEGRTCMVSTRGNPWGHLILRGGRTGPNYSPDQVQAAVDMLTKVNLPPRLVIDCSHANSNKDYRNQPAVWRDVLAQRAAGGRAIVGVMLESNLFPGNQKLNGDLSKLQYGVSITDACLGWEETEQLILEAAG